MRSSASRPRRMNARPLEPSVIQSSAKRLSSLARGSIVWASFMNRTAPVRSILRGGDLRSLGCLDGFEDVGHGGLPVRDRDQTVEPLAKARKLKVQETRHLAEGARLKGAYRFIEDQDLDDTVLCTHGDVIMELVDDLIRRRLVKASQAAFDKGSTWAVEVDDGSPVGARYMPAP